MTDGNLSGEENGSDSDWEYVYDPEETETFYVAIDFSAGMITSASAQQGVQSAAGKRKSGRPRRSMPDEETRDDATEDATVMTASVLDAGDDEDEQMGAAMPVVQRDPSPHTVREPGDDLNSPETIQIIDLHTPHPMVAYRNCVYQCSWTELVGAGLFLSKGSDEAALRQGGSWSLLGVSDIILKGLPVTLKPRQGYDNYEGPVDEDLSPWIPDVAPAVQNDHVKQLQTPFLARLSRLKIQKGEREGVTFLAKYPPRTTPRRKKGPNAGPNEEEDGDEDD